MVVMAIEEWCGKFASIVQALDGEPLPKPFDIRVDELLALLLVHNKPS
jgi:hypothetical protein